MTEPSNIASSILVITSKKDTHVGAVSQYLESAGVDWVRINTEDVPINLSVSIAPSTGTGRIGVHDSGRSFSLESVRAVWYRKPEPLELGHFEMSGEGLEYAAAEFNEILQGIYALTSNAFWINHPLGHRIPHRKLAQLQVAKSVGFTTPPTIVTNSPSEACEFAESVGWDVAIKALGALSVTDQRPDRTIQYGLFTRRISKDELISQRDRVAHMPTLLQAYVEKQYELRVTCVGTTQFACKISAESGALAEDVRFDIMSLPHEIVSCPQIERPIHDYMRRFNLAFGCFDIAVTPAGEYVFLECNPNGQWLWIEQKTGAPIGKAIAELLISRAAIRTGSEAN